MQAEEQLEAAGRCEHELECRRWRGRGVRAPGKRACIVRIHFASGWGGRGGRFRRGATGGIARCTRCAATAAAVVRRHTEPLQALLVLGELVQVALAAGDLELLQQRLHLFFFLARERAVGHGAARRGHVQLERHGAVHRLVARDDKRARLARRVGHEDAFGHRHAAGAAGAKVKQRRVDAKVGHLAHVGLEHDRLVIVGVRDVGHQEALVERTRERRREGKVDAARRVAGHHAIAAEREPDVATGDAAALADAVPQGPLAPVLDPELALPALARLHLAKVDVRLPELQHAPAHVRPHHQVAHRQLVHVAALEHLELGCMRHARRVKLEQAQEDARVLLPRRALDVRAGAPVRRVYRDHGHFGVRRHLEHADRHEASRVDGLLQRAPQVDLGAHEPLLGLEAPGRHGGERARLRLERGEQRVQVEPRHVQRVGEHRVRAPPPGERRRRAARRGVRRGRRGRRGRRRGRRGLGVRARWPVFAERAERAVLLRLAHA